MIRHLMPCIFGFGFHEWFTPSDLTHVKKSDILQDLPICQECKLKLENEYNLIQKKMITFNDFLNFHIEERLKILSMVWSESNVTDEQMEKLTTICTHFVDYSDIDVDDSNSVLEEYLELHGMTGCDCCGITNHKLLTIDHKNGNKVFCYNCTIGTAFNGGICPCRS